MAAVFIVTFFVIIQRFYKNLLGDEGYLMNTLPVTTITNITSKISIATFWNIVSGLVALLSILIMAFNADAFSTFSGIFPSISEGYDEFGSANLYSNYRGNYRHTNTLTQSVTMIFASISIGHLFNKHRILSSFCAFIVINFITTAISSALGMAFSYSNLTSLFDKIHFHL